MFVFMVSDCILIVFIIILFRYVVLSYVHTISHQPASAILSECYVNHKCIRNLIFSSNDNKAPNICFGALLQTLLPTLVFTVNSINLGPQMHGSPYRPHSQYGGGPPQALGQLPVSNQPMNLPTGPTDSKPGSIAYSTTTGPDGRLVYQPFR